ncbi:putative hydro-lyase [Paraburkholderia phosphatilytica]|uniref:putative hydro-lyase n=1 Tax=Paraburkholderia phosphatilytica TaxID=2282883 RepID=UPI000E50C5FA|nr:putative hydro-lyase [Paraburkholderia phosphatilytica]
MAVLTFVQSLRQDLTLMPHDFRRQVRSKTFTGPTAGFCGEYAQANLAIVPAEFADDFLRFCVRNPKACPLLAVGEPGAWSLPALGRDLDIRTDAPGYNVYRHGELCEQPSDLLELWRDDLVAFAIGCSFSFEQMLARERIPLRHIDEGVNVPMYRTTIDNQRAGRFGGKLVVSMRPMSGADAIRAVQVTSRFPSIHGAPIHIGNPAALGIADLSRPTYGDAVSIHEHEIPVFWACGVTPQSALESAKLPFAIAHRPGHMLMTDITNASLAVL